MYLGSKSSNSLDKIASYNPIRMGHTLYYKRLVKKEAKYDHLRLIGSLCYVTPHINPGTTLLQDLVFYIVESLLSIGIQSNGIAN